MNLTQEPVATQVVAPAASAATKALWAYTGDVASRYYSRPATAEEIAVALSEDPSDDLAPPHGLFLVARREATIVGSPGCAYCQARSDAGLDEITAGVEPEGGDAVLTGESFDPGHQQAAQPAAALGRHDEDALDLRCPGLPRRARARVQRRPLPPSTGSPRPWTEAPHLAHP